MPQQRPHHVLLPLVVLRSPMALLHPVPPLPPMGGTINATTTPGGVVAGAATGAATVGHPACRVSTPSLALSRSGRVMSRVSLALGLALLYHSSKGSRVKPSPPSAFHKLLAQVSARHPASARPLASARLQVSAPLACLPASAHPCPATGQHPPHRSTGIRLLSPMLTAP